MAQIPAAGGRADDSQASTEVRSPLGDAGWRPGPAWATPEQAARLADRLADCGDVVRRPYLTLPEIATVVRDPAIIEAVETLIGPDIALEGGFLLSKPAHSDFAVPWHQDGTNDHIELDPARSVTAWVALTDATAENGALEVIPGSWHGGYLPYRRAEPQPGQPGRPLFTDVPPGLADPVIAAVPAGQALLMDVRLLHRSGPNISDASRIGLNLRYVAPGAVTHRPGMPAASLYPITGSW